MLDKASLRSIRLQRRITLCERSYRESLAEMERLQAAREASPQPEESKAKTPRLGSFHIFLFRSAAPPLPMLSIKSFCLRALLRLRQNFEIGAI